MHNSNLKGKTAIVTGVGGDGIGFATAEVLAEAGANVAVTWHQNATAIDHATKIASTYGVKCKAYQLDIADQHAVEKIINEIVADFNGRLDIFIANSGMPWSQGPAISGEISHYQKVMSTNLDGTYYCARAAGQIWSRQYEDGKSVDGKLLENYTMGSFVATASVAATKVSQLFPQAPYNIGKAGIVTLCRSLAIEWAAFARCNSVSPGVIKTDAMRQAPPAVAKSFEEKVPLKRAGDPKEVAAAFLYLASDAASYVTGTDLVVDGGIGLI